MHRTNYHIVLVRCRMEASWQIKTSTPKAVLARIYHVIVYLVG